MARYTGNEDSAVRYVREINYLRKILDTLKPVEIEGSNTDLSEVIQKQDNILNTLRGDFAEKVTDLEQRVKKLTLRVYGIPEMPNEDTETVLLDYFHHKLRVSVCSADIDCCYRLGALNSARPRTIIVKFVSDSARKNLLRRKYRLENGCWNIEEELGYDRSLLKRQAIAEFGTKNVSVENGIITVQLPGGESKDFHTSWELQKYLGNAEKALKYRKNH